MLLVILAIGLVAMIVGFILETKAYKANQSSTKSWYICRDWGDEYPVIWVPGVCVSAFALLVITILVGCSISAKYIPEKIDMYEQENAAIEEQIATVVNDYMEYEEGIFKDISPDEAMTVVLLYPDLKANAVVERQMEVYIANNEKIKELKEKHISAKTYKWWLYFGG